MPSDVTKLCRRFLDAAQQNQNGAEYTVALNDV